MRPLLMRLCALAVLGALAVGCSQPAAPPADPAPPPAAEAPAPPPADLRYGCTDGTLFTLKQDFATRRAVIEVDGRDEPIGVESAVVASGFAYVAPGVRFHGKDSEALLQLGSDPERSCAQVPPGVEGGAP